MPRIKVGSYRGHGSNDLTALEYTSENTTTDESTVSHECFDTTFEIGHGEIAFPVLK